MKRSVIIGTAGHIDHGKTALVKALTGIDTDRLPEEKARGITIDIGFAHTEWNNIDVSFIDVPGHERFIRNMLAGIGGIHLLMLVVAADESIMPQTREHFEICRLLQIPKGVIVITKKDLVDSETLVLVEQEIRDLVKESFLESAPVFTVSAKSGDGIDLLKEGLLKEISETHFESDTGLFRLPIDRVFVLKGHGTVVTGTLISGRIKKDHFATLLPSQKSVKVRSIHAHDTNVDAAVSGQRTALNLQGIEKEEIQRGDVLVEPGVFRSTSLLDVQIDLLSGVNPLPHNALVRFHHLTNDVAARITLLGKNRLQPGDSAFAQLRLQYPIHAFYGDRFILRKHSPFITIGGGVILDHFPIRRISAGDSAALERLQKLESAQPELRLSISVQEKGFNGAEEEYLQAKLGMAAAEISKLNPDSVIYLRKQPILALDRKTEEALIAKMHMAVSNFHKKNPLQFGISKEELRSKIWKNISPDVFTCVLDRAVQEKKLQLQKDLVAEFGRSVALDDQQEALASRIEEYLQQSGLGTPGLEDLSKELKQPIDRTKNMLYLLVREKKAIKISDDYFLHKTAWDELKQKVRALKTRQKTFSVPDFKALFGISRKFAIPLLESLDREGITRRAGNERIIL
jgi:selenocysteine-specific elongation factor